MLTEAGLAPAGEAQLDVSGSNDPSSSSRRTIAGLYTLVATCEARGINPFAYLADVIPCVQDHPKRRLDELLPGPWSRTRA